jgi:transposase InsO family protein
VGTIKGVGRICQQNFIDTCSRVATTNLYTDKSAITAADLLKDRVIPFVDAQGIQLNRFLTDRSTEYGRAQAGTSRRTTPISSTWRWRTSTIPGLRPTIPSPTASASGSTKPSRTNPPEAESLPSRKKLYRSLEELQVDLDAWLEGYNRERPHSGRYCYGKTPWETFQQSKHLALAKDLSRGGDQSDNTTRQPVAVS